MKGLAGHSASARRESSQVQPMDVSLDQKATATATKQRAGTQLTTNNVESGFGVLRSVAGHQAERADSMLPVEAVKYSANTIADVGYQHEHYWKVVGKQFSVIRPLMVLVCVWQRSHQKRGNMCAGELAALRSSNTKGTMVSQTRKH